MHWIDWCIFIIPLSFVIGMAVYSRKFVRGVVDFLAAGRVAGRYVIAVGDLSAGLSVISLVALVEAKYQTGYALGFWENIIAPIGIVISLTGYCVYRYRETRSLSIGQFLEMRYSRPFRIVAATLRTIAEMLTNAIGPAIAANFFIYFLGLPHRIHLFGFDIPCFAIVVIIVLTLAMSIIWPAGRISLLITDCFQGLMSYPIFVLIVGYILVTFSWSGEIAPVMLDRVPGENFLNPYDVSQLRDFNIFALVVSVFGQILNRASWIGNDTSNSGRTPHEQKMAGILGSWRNGFSFMMCMLVAIMIITMMSHENFADQSHKIRKDLTTKVTEEIIPKDQVKRQRLQAKLDKIPVQRHKIGKDKPLGRMDNIDTPYMKIAHAEFLLPAKSTYLKINPNLKNPDREFETFVRDAGKKNSPAQRQLIAEGKKDSRYQVLLDEIGSGNLSFQKFRTLYQQMMMPVALRHMFPIGLTGIFALLMIMLLVSTDDSRIFNASSTIVQDVILPFRKNPFTPKEHVFWLRIASALVAVFFFICSLVFVQLDYINMLTTILCSMWLGGAGPVMIFGLYSRFGSTAGAWASIVFGSGTSILGLFCQRNWPDHIYPMLMELGWVESVGNFLTVVSAPFNPLIVWEMDPVKFPINSYEIYFISMLLGVIAYISASLLSYIKIYTGKEAGKFPIRIAYEPKPYNLDRMLHRGKYSIDGEKKISEPWTLKSVWGKLIGITPEYTRGDKIIAWSVFIYTFVYKIGISFLLVLVWNLFYPWPVEWWSWYFYIISILMAGVVGIVSTFWFLIGGIVDTRRLFRDLAARVDNPLDNGMVNGHVSAVDAERLEKEAKD